MQSHYLHSARAAQLSAVCRKSCVGWSQSCLVTKLKSSGSTQAARRGSVENVQTFAGLQLDRHVIDVGRFDDD